MKVIFEKNGLTKEVKCGFSWTTFIFGGIVQIIRGEYIIGILLLLAWSIGAHFVYAFFANKVTARKLIEDGWTVYRKDNPLVQTALRKWEVNA